MNEAGREQIELPWDNYIMLTQDESIPSVFIGGLRILNVIDFTILGLLAGIAPHVAVFSSPHGLTLSGVEHSLAAEEALGDIGWYFQWC